MQGAALARISHQSREAWDYTGLRPVEPTPRRADSPMSTALRSKNDLDVLARTPVAIFLHAPYIHGTLHQLATKIGEKCGLAILFKS